MKKIPFGVITPLVTPYCQSDLFNLLDHVLTGGISHIFILGTTGEAFRLSQSYKIKMIEKTAAYLDRKAQLYVGITSAHIADSIDLMKAAEAAGACASVVIPSLLGENCPAVLDRLLSSTSGNLMIYNNPSLTNNVSLSIEEIRSFFDERRILGIKDSSGDLNYLDQLIKIRKSPSFAIFYGREHNLKEAFEREINGIVPGSSNIDPKLFTTLWEEKEKGPWEQLVEIKKAIQAMHPTHYLAGLKLLLKERGIISDARLW